MDASTPSFMVDDKGDPAMMVRTSMALPASVIRIGTNNGQRVLELSGVNELQIEPGGKYMIDASGLTSLKLSIVPYSKGVSYAEVWITGKSADCAITLDSIYMKVSDGEVVSGADSHILLQLVDTTATAYVA